ncbi:MAG: trigger factor [Lachnospiraceae bacterium]|nr:trigger factor [Lachnospiraceae bacterium]
MKKKFVYFLMTAMMAGMISACGSTESKEEGQTQTQTEDRTGTEDEAGTKEQTEEIVLKDLDVESHVTLNEYKGMSVTLQKPTVSDEEVDAVINSAVRALGGTEGAAIMDRAVEEGDVVNINYAGTMDGVAFEGGTDDSEGGTDLEIGAGGFVPGFEDGIIGVMPGETVDVEVTFPEDYYEDMAGKDAVFAITVNGIAPSELTEELLPYLNEETTTIEEYRQSVYDSLMEDKQAEFDYYYDSQIEDALISILVEECSYTDIPEALVEKYHTNIVNNITAAASMYGMDLETYGQLAYGMSEYTDFENMMQEWAELSAKQSVAFQAIANKENLNISDEKLDEELEIYVANAGYESVEEFLQGASKEEYREYLMFTAVLDFLRENAAVTVE